MSPQCPDIVDPERFADREGTCSGSIVLDRFERLAPLLVNNEGAVDFTFRFSRDMHRRPMIEGHVKAVLWLQCQRCMVPCQLNIDSDFVLVVVQGFDEADKLPIEVDPVMVEDEHLSLVNLLEDELLLAVPAIPRHITCEAESTESGGEIEHEAVRENPFDILASLKKTGD